MVCMSKIYIYMKISAVSLSSVHACVAIHFSCLLFNQYAGR